MSGLILETDVLSVLEVQHLPLLHLHQWVPEGDKFITVFEITVVENYCCCCAYQHSHCPVLASAPELALKTLKFHTRIIII